MKKIIIVIALLCNIMQVKAENRLKIGTNIAGLSDYMTEMPLVDLMHHCRSWMTSNVVWVSDGENEWDTGFIDQIPKDENGYPLSLPYYIAEAETLQAVHTIWAYLYGWPEGNYTLLYDGDGDFVLSGDLTTVSQEPGRIILQFTPPENEEGQFVLQITRSDVNNHIRNIRLLMPGAEQTYETMPYYSEWFNKLQPFKIIRFMDWGYTNNWGNEYSWECYDEDSDTLKVEWEERSQLYNYTWATNKGVPYEVMIDVCNKLNADMWICVPHSASDDYIFQLATLLKNNLNPSLKIYVEYSNEIWNWMFGQTQWLYKFGCVNKGKEWPEGIVPYIQNCMDIFSNVFNDDITRLVRVVGVQSSWLDVSQRIVFNMRSGSFDAFAPAAYFGIDEQTDSELDALGASATVQDIVARVRNRLDSNEKQWLREQKNEIGDPLGIPMIYYEGGQHFTPAPFGEEPTYAQALLDVQRDTCMYNLYREWFTFLETLASSDYENLFVNFSFIDQRSARYGSWGILESVHQDTNVIPAPKYSAITDYINMATDIENNRLINPVMKLEQNYPNPFNPITQINYSVEKRCNISLKVYNIVGQEVKNLFEGDREPGNYTISFNGIGLASGVYIYKLKMNNSVQMKKLILLK